MLALLGMLYLCQMCLLPGLIILYLLGFRRLLQVLLMAMPVSLTANYVLFHLLNSAGLRDQATWLTVAGVEILVLLAIAWRERRTTLAEAFQADIARVRQWIRENLTEQPQNRSWNAILLAMGLASVASFAVLAFYEPGLATFSGNDDTLSWARWATEWAQHGAASWVWWYPQLGPVNFAVGYIFLGTTEIHLFAKMAMPLFALLIVGMLLDLELQHRDRRFLLATAIVGWLYWHYAGGAMISSGCMDIPAAMMVLAAVYPLLSVRGLPGRDAMGMAFVSAIVAAGAVWTKQTGLFVLFAAVGVWWWQRRENAVLLRLWMVGVVIGAVILAAACFYVPQALKIAHGADESNLPILRSLTWRDPWFGNDLLGAVYHYPAFSALVLGGAALSCLGRDRYRHLSVPLLLLAYAIWGALFNYEIRNYFFAFPYLALALGGGILAWLPHLTSAMAGRLRVRVIPVSAIGVLVAATLAVGLARVPDSVVRNRQRNANLQQISFGISNDILLSTADFIAPNAKIATFYHPATTIPEAKGRLVRVEPSSFMETMKAEDCRFLFVEPSLFGASWEESGKGAMAAIDDARRKGILRPVMARYNATLYYYDPAEMRAEYGGGE